MGAQHGSSSMPRWQMFPIGMPKRKETRLDADKFLNPERIRINLLLSSLYLSAFEILRLSVIDSTRDFFVFSQEITEEQARESESLLGEGTVNHIREHYLEQVQEYKRCVGVKFDTPDQHALIPSCRWLLRMGVLDESEVDEIERIRDYRNEIAHELPDLLIGEGMQVDVRLFARMRELLRKIDAFWARVEPHFNLGTHEQVNMDDVPDESILSGRTIVLDVIVETVRDYLTRSAR